MARRKRNPAARWIDWSPALAELFRLAAIGPDGGWSPPAQVRVTLGQSRRTVSARFQAGDGRVMTARVRLARDHHSGAWDVTDEELSIPLGAIRGEAR